MTDETNPMGMRSLAETMSVPMGEQLGNTIKKVIGWDWIFSTWYEKIIVAGSIAWTFYCIGRFIYGIF